MNRTRRDPYERPFREIIVKFREGEGRSLKMDGDDLVAERLSLAKFNENFARLQKEVGRATKRQSFARLSRILKKSDDWNAIYVGVGGRIRLDHFVRVRVFDPKIGLDQLCKIIASDPDVAYAVPALLDRPAQSTVTSDLTGSQGYLGPGGPAVPGQSDNGGVDAEYSWRVSGGNGDGVRVCVIDKSYNRAHEAFTDDDITRIRDIIAPMPGASTILEQHGNLVMGVLAPDDNVTGLTGVCHGSEHLFASSYEWTIDEIIDEIYSESMVETEDDENQNRLRPGDILVIEAQAEALSDPEVENSRKILVPCEINPDTRAAIWTLVNVAKVIVVEAAGNGGVNDRVGVDLAEITGKSFTEDRSIGGNLTAEEIAALTDGKIWNFEAGEAGGENDSSAILVGGGHPGSTDALDPAPHSKTTGSNFGSRVNCQGWGDKVASAGDQAYGDLEKHYDPGEEDDYNRSYTKLFSGTSSATAIVAGVVACLQGAVKAASPGMYIEPDQMRELLRQPRYGTPQPGADPVTGVATPGSDAEANPIGPLPDLRKLLCAKEIGQLLWGTDKGICPDVYLRDSLADTGEEPSPGFLSRSPDIIVRNNQVADPVSAFGVGVWSKEFLGEDVVANPADPHAPAYIYLRMLNRGHAPDDVTVSVYWTKSTSFPHPSYWNLIGELTENDIRDGEYRVSSNPIEWERSDIPAAGSYCLIAVLSSEQDPVSIPTSFSTTSAFLDFVKAKNNVCFRNIKVVDVSPSISSAWFKLRLNGMPERRAPFRFVIRPQLPPGTEIVLKARLPIMQWDGFRHESPLTGPASGGRLIWPVTREIVLDNIMLGPGSRQDVTIQVKLPWDDIPYAPGIYQLFIDQYLIDPRRVDPQVGRMTLYVRAAPPLGPPGPPA